MGVIRLLYPAGNIENSSVTWGKSSYKIIYSRILNPITLTSHTLCESQHHRSPACLIIDGYRTYYCIRLKSDGLQVVTCKYHLVIMITKQRTGEQMPMQLVMRGVTVLAKQLYIHE